MCAQAGLEPHDIPAELCLDWAGHAASSPSIQLATIGVHTLTHPMLAKHPEAFVRSELAESRAQIEQSDRQARPALAYPVGDPTSAGPREFAMARELGFASAVTTRPGMIFPEHAAHLTALPRLSVNGRYQNLDYAEASCSPARRSPCGTGAAASTPLSGPAARSIQRMSGISGKIQARPSTA